MGGVMDNRQRGFTLLELMVVFALIGALSVAFLMDIGTTMAKSHAIQQVRDIHALGRATLKMEDVLKNTASSVTGGNLVIKGAFPRGGITQTNNSFTSAIGTSITVSWSKAAKELSIANAAVPQGDCVDVLKNVNAAQFRRIVVTAGATTNTLTRANWPITLASAANACPTANSTITFVIRL